MPKYLIDRLLELSVDYPIRVSKGEETGTTVVHKFGRNIAVGTSFVPVTIGGVYQTPQVSGATALRIKAGNAADTSDGNGARTVYVEGLDATGALVNETLTTNGESAGSAGSVSFLRVFRAYVLTSGTYGTQSTGSHSADVVIENSAGGTDWVTISAPASDFPRGQSEIGAYTVPLGKTAYVKSIAINSDASKSTDILMFQRRDILQTAAPYSAMRAVLEFGGAAGKETLYPNSPIGPFPALTDIGFMARVSTQTGEVDVDFEILLVDD